jgi:hypothetical protein
MGYLKIFIILLFINCTQTTSHSELWELHYWFLYGKEMPRKVLWVEDAMKRWELGLRWIPGENIKETNHWIAVSKDLKCEESFLADYKKDCESANNATSISDKLLGLCLIDNDKLKPEKITQSQIILNSSIFNFATQDAATDIISHEIGHCLGLIHVYTYSNLMYPAYHGQAGREPQKSLLKKIYIDNQDISPTDIKIYFQNTSNKLIKHESLPVRMIIISSFK